MIERVVVFGGHVQALGLARQAHAKGKEVVLLIEDKYQIAKYSRSVNRAIVCSLDKGERLAVSGERDIETILKELELPERSTLLFPTNDQAVEFLSEHYEEYKERFALGVPEPEVIELFNNKRTAYRYAAAHKVPCPECWYPDTIAEVEEMSRTLPYPVVVKPAIMYSFHATFGKKAFRCDDAEQLLNVYKRIAEAKYPLESILIQEFLVGGPKHLYSYGVMAAEGKPLVAIQANRIRQNPMDFGNSTTFAVTCDIPEIEAQSVRLLAETRYFGLGEVEWMWDEKSGQYKFLEINTRAWKWHTLSNQRHFSFIGKMIEYFDSIDDFRFQIYDLGEKINIDKHCYADINIDKEDEINKKEGLLDTCCIPNSIDHQSACEQAPRQPNAQSCSIDSVAQTLSNNPSQKNVDSINCGKNNSTVAWCERLTDFAVVFKEWIHGRMKLGEVMKSYRIPHESAVWSWRDPVPAIMYILLSPILYIKRH